MFGKVHFLTTRFLFLKSKRKRNKPISGYINLKGLWKCYEDKISYLQTNISIWPFKRVFECNGNAWSLINTRNVDCEIVLQY